MASSSTDPLNIELDILGQQPSLGIYTQVCQCFGLHDDSQAPEIANKLKDGLERLASAFPWAAGQVVCEGASEGVTTGTVFIRPSSRTPLLTVKDLRDDPSAITIDTLRKARFPMCMLHESVIASRYTLPGGPNEVTNPVFLVQATFIRGGLILTFMGQHQAMDVVGLGELMSLLSTACHNTPFTDEQLVTMNLARHNTIPTYDDSYDPIPDTDNQVLKPPSASNPSTPAKVTWANVAFSAQDLASIKVLATETLPSGSRFVSTDDALTAFIWQSITRTRLTRFDGSADARLARAVDVRPFMGMPKRYPGLYQFMTYHQYTLEELSKAPLGVVAAELRSALQADKLVHSTRAIATHFQRTPDKRIFSFTANIDPTRDLMLSSWVKEDCYSFDYNLGLGAPEAVRRPSFTPYESLAYLLPRKPGGDSELVVALALRDEDWHRLRGDPEFTKFATYIG